jgi:hypothetical protein
MCDAKKRFNILCIRVQKCIKWMHSVNILSIRMQVSAQKNEWINFIKSNTLELQTKTGRGNV